MEQNPFLKKSVQNRANVQPQPQRPFIPQQPQAYQSQFPQQQPTDGMNMPQFSTGYEMQLIHEIVEMQYLIWLSIKQQIW